MTGAPPAGSPGGAAVLDASSWDRGSSGASPSRTAVAAAPARQARRIAGSLSRAEMVDLTPSLHAVVRLRIWSPGAPAGAPRAGQDPPARPGLQARISRGFLIDGQGYVLTSDRVVQDARLIEVSLHDGRTLPGSLVARDALNDVAVLKIPATGLPSIPLGESRDLMVGDQVMAPRGPPGLDRVLTTATVRATGTASNGNIAVDLTPRSDGWGGPLLDRRGYAVGIVTSDAGVTSTQRSMTFAVPIDRAEIVLRKLPFFGSAAGPIMSDR
jgi:S1-C subfamily serine protease